MPTTRISAADPGKLHRQIARFGRSNAEMPPILLNRGLDGELAIVDGVTRATRMGKLSPRTLVQVEVLDAFPVSFGHLPTVGERLP
jgi:hypothetical protein